MDPFMGASGEPEWQVATGSPLDFESLFVFDQMELSEGCGPPAFTSDQFAAPQLRCLTNVDVDLSLNPNFCSDPTNGTENGFVTPLDLQQIHPPVEQSSFDLFYAEDQSAQPYCLSNPAEFVPPQTPLFAQGSDQAAQLAAWYTQASEYYQFRANL